MLNPCPLAVKTSNKRACVDLLAEAASGQGSGVAPMCLANLYATRNELPAAAIAQNAILFNAAKSYP